ncbi:MAG: bifunctional pyr operon transcriptional regulator/uracil phosphoribosyltransferase, partial [Deltaproteobacteria bacterium]|nr:bifunctional pyr operon transcriptional regulator/uracil phosphoribosyltransferase [Deltaproteobacteria bacterium]
MSTEQVILQAPDIDRILTRITHELLEKHRGSENLLLIGIWTGGVFLADRIAARILSIDGTKIPRGDLDI